MNWSEQIFTYCERGQNPAYWAEPLNAVTNAAFLIAAMVAFVIWLRQPPENRRITDLVLTLLVAIIGIGSFLFHTLATRWASMADVIPIGIFMLAYMAYALKRFFNVGWLITAFGLLVFVIGLWQAGQMRCDGGRCLNGSAAYIPAFIALVVLGLLLAANRHRAGLSLVAAGLIFAVSLTARTVDMAICPSSALTGAGPMGTHFIWHLLNATLLFILLRAAILYGGTNAGIASKR
ncbi:MAG: ceramidase domain-containing protein [Hyphomicrobiaceae bacterium]